MPALAHDVDTSYASSKTQSINRFILAIRTLENEFHALQRQKGGKGGK